MKKIVKSEFSIYGLGLEGLGCVRTVVVPKTSAPDTFHQPEKYNPGHVPRINGLGLYLGLRVTVRGHLSVGSCPGLYFSGKAGVRGRCSWGNKLGVSKARVMGQV